MTETVRVTPDGRLQRKVKEIGSYLWQKENLQMPQPGTNVELSATAAGDLPVKLLVQASSPALCITNL